jgi:adenylate cyclase
LQQRPPVAAGAATLTVFLAAAVLLPKTPSEVLRDRAFDVELAGGQWLRRPATSDLKVIVVDIDRASIDALGAWPWPRETIARLVEAVATGRPAAIAIDVLFAEPDDRSPAALARRLGSLTGRAEISTLAESLPDGDKWLARAINSVPVALGFVLNPDRDGALPGAAIVSRGPLPFYDLWQATGAIGPTAPLAAAARGLGALSLPGSADGAIRQVPVFVAVGGSLMPGLAAEALRLVSGASSYLIEGEPPTLVVGSRRVALSRDGLLRLVPVAPSRHVARTLSAVDVLEGRAGGDRLAGALVLLGGSAPELGGLRKTPADPLTPSVQIQADAVEQMVSGRVPRTLAAGPIVQPLSVLVIGALAVGLGAALSPAIGTAILIAAIALLWIAAIGVSALADRLVDPLTPSVAAVLVFTATAGTAYSLTLGEIERMGRLRRFLPPQVADLIVASGTEKQLESHRREITALFCDLRGFTGFSESSDPEDVMALLRDYHAAIGQIIFKYGGTLERFAGDGVMVIFNDPVPVENPALQAVLMALEMRTAIGGMVEKWRDLGHDLGFGIGIAHGFATLGTIGFEGRFDYAAIGTVSNVASRLCDEAKPGQILISPRVRLAVDKAVTVEPVGELALKGIRRPMMTYNVLEPLPSKPN